MLTEELTSEEQIQVDSVLKSMGLNEADKYKDEVQSDLKEDIDKNWSNYDKDQYSEKPEFIKRKEQAVESKRRGISIHEDGLIPLKNMVTVRMDSDRDEVSKGGIILADLRSIKQDNPKCEIVRFNNDTKYDFKIGDTVVIDFKTIMHRYNYKEQIYLILNKDGVMAIYE